MLEGLNAVDWPSLTHCHGAASDVPGLLRALLSADPEVRTNSATELFGNIWHQGTVYPASAAAVPFLYELLEAHETPDKSNIAHLLACIAGGVGYLEVHAVGEFAESSWRKILAQQGKTLEGEMSREADGVACVRRAASVGLKLLLSYLHDPEPEVRWSVAAALGKYPEHKAWSLPAIDAALATEPDEEVCAALAASRACLADRVI